MTRDELNRTFTAALAEIEDWVFDPEELVAVTMRNNEIACHLYESAFSRVVDNLKLPVWYWDDARNHLYASHNGVRIIAICQESHGIHATCRTV